MVAATEKLRAETESVYRTRDPVVRLKRRFATSSDTGAVVVFCHLRVPSVCITMFGFRTLIPAVLKTRNCTQGDLLFSAPGFIVSTRSTMPSDQFRPINYSP